MGDRLTVTVATGAQVVIQMAHGTIFRAGAESVHLKPAHPATRRLRRLRRLRSRPAVGSGASERVPFLPLERDSPDSDGEASATATAARRRLRVGPADPGAEASA